MQSSRTPTAVFLAVFTIVFFAAFVHAQDRTDEGRLNATGGIPEANAISGTTHRRATSVRVVQVSEIPQINAGNTSAQASSAATQKSSAVAGSSLVLQTFQGPVDSNPPDPAMAVGPNHVVATVNSTITIYDKKGAVLFTTSIAAFMFNPTAAVWDTHVLYDANSGHFFVVCVTGDQSTTGAMLLAVSATPDARGTWYLYTLKEAKNAWLDFPAPTVTRNSLVLSFMDIPAQGSTQKGICATEVIGLAELVSGNHNLKITRFDSVFGQPGQCNYANPVSNYDAGSIAYLLTINSPNGSGDSLALARIDTSGTPVLNVSTIPVPHYTFLPGTVPQKGSSTGIYPGTPDITSASLRNGSLWCAHTTAATDGSAVVRWYEIDPGSRTVKQVGDVAGLGNAWMGAIAVLPDNEVDLVYTTSSSTEYVSAGYAHRSAADAPNSMPISGVYQAGSGAFSGQRWGDFFEAWADPDGLSAWGIAEYAGTSTYGTAIVQLASSSGVSVTPQIALTVTPTSATVNAGESATFAVSVTSQNAGAITFSCSGLPTGGACTFNPTSLNGSGTAELTITTARTSGALAPASSFALGIFAAIFGLTLLPGLHRRTRYLGMLLMVCALAAIVACSGTSSPSNPQPPPSGSTTTSPPPTPPPPPTPSGPTPPVSPSSTAQSFAVTINATGAGTQASATVALTVR